MWRTKLRANDDVNLKQKNSVYERSKEDTLSFQQGCNLKKTQLEISPQNKIVSRLMQ